MLLVAAFVDDNFIGPKHGISLAIISDSKQVAMSIPDKEIEKLREKFVLVITVFNLLQYLSNEGLIILIGEKMVQGQLGEQFKGGHTTFIPEPIASFVTDSLNKYILISEEFKNIVNSNFEDPEQKRHKQTIAISIFALIISVLLGLYSVISGYTNKIASENHIDLINNDLDENANKIETAIITLNNTLLNSSLLIKEIDENLLSISKEIKLISKNNILDKNTDLSNIK